MRNYLSVLIALVVAVVPAVSLAAYGGSASSIGSTLTKDSCPNGDNSGSYYDNDCGTTSDTTTTDDTTTEEENTSGVTLDGVVWFDDNNNGSQDTGEDGVQGAVVTLKTSGNQILDTDVTSSNGYYAFYNVMPGTYKLHVSLPLTSTSLLDSVVALFVPSVNAANDYEFTVVIPENAEGNVRAGNVPVVDGEAQNVVAEEEEMNDDTMMEDEDDTDEETSQNIKDLIAASNAGNSDASVTSSINTSSSNGNGGFVLPTSLPNTGANG